MVKFNSIGYPKVLNSVEENWSEGPELPEVAARYLDDVGDVVVMVMTRSMGMIVKVMWRRMMVIIVMIKTIC